MTATSSVLALGDPDGRFAELTQRIRALGFTTVRAKTPRDAVAAAEERRHRYRVALVESDVPALDLRAALESLRRHPSADHLRILVVGPRPERGEIERLRTAGIERALWEPIAEHALRFELNRCYADPFLPSDRDELRAAASWNARIFIAGRQKAGTIYSFSPKGAFVATPRPQVRGAKVVLELPLDDGAVSVGGSVVYANVPGNLRKANLPSGMAVCFEDVRDEERARLRDAVARCDGAHRV